MLVTMKARISGTRNGQDWPAPGEQIDLPEAEARAMEALGAVEIPKPVEPEVSEPAKPATTRPRKPETR